MSSNQDLILKVKKLIELGEKLDKSIIINTGVGYSDHSDYFNWIKSEMRLLKDSVSLLENDSSYGSIFPIIRTVFEDYWIILLAMNGTKFYRYFKVKSGQSVERIFKSWNKQLIEEHKKGNKKNILFVKKTKSKIIVAYEGTFVKNSNEVLPYYYLLLNHYDPTKAYIGKEKRIIENYLTPYHYFKKGIETNKLYKEDYFDTQGINNSLLLNKFIKKGHIQKINVHYNFLSSWVHPNKKKFDLLKNEYDYWNGKKKRDFFLDHLALLYIGNLASLFLESFLIFCSRQIKEKKIIGIKDNCPLENLISEFQNFTSYFWFIYNKPSSYFKFNYCTNRAWRSILHKRQYKALMPYQIPDELVPYYNDPLNTLKNMSIGLSNKVYGKYTPPQALM